MEDKNKELIHLDVSKYVENKSGLNYLSWTYAWGEAIKHDCKANYRVLKFENNLPYVYDKKTGYMVFTEVTIDSVTREMWLFVMNGANKALFEYDYTYKVKDWNESKKQCKTVMQDKTVEKASMFDVNKTIMRCLVKNIAMFGLGLYVYSGEDLPEESEEAIKEKEEALIKANKEIQLKAEKALKKFETEGIKALNKCESLENLGKVWTEYSKLQKNEDFVKVKELLKTKLSK